MLKCYIFLFMLECILVPKAYCLHDENNDKLVLKPSELVDFILEERIGMAAPTDGSLQDGNVISLLKLDDLDSQVAETEPEQCTDDGETLRSRKLWSRWSKWGACSVSCGDGVMTRRRVCVAGRCARGEREEQRRACRRAPCRHNAHQSD